MYVHVNQKAGDVIRTHRNIRGWASFFDRVYVGRIKELPSRILPMAYLVSAMPHELLQQ